MISFTNLLTFRVILTILGHGLKTSVPFKICQPFPQEYIYDPISLEQAWPFEIHADQQGN